MKKRILIFLLAIVTCFTITGCGKNDEKNNEKPTDNPNKYGVVEKTTIFDTIDKFNVELSNNEKKYFANNDYMIAENDLYWYGIYEDITLYVKPISFSNDLKKDITELIAIRYNINSKNEQMALNYVKHLIKSNNSTLSEQEIADLMTKANEQSKEGKTVSNGKGITVGVLKTDKIIEYQIVRLYE